MDGTLPAVARFPATDTVRTRPPFKKQDVPRQTLRIPGLDGLRGIAALSVLVYHFTTRVTNEFDVFECPVNYQFRLGKYGVQLFFLISGFVIFMTVERTKRPIDFVTSRFARLYPAYWISLLLVVGWLMLAPGWEGSPDLRRVLGVAAAGVSMVPGWFQIGTLSSVYWSLQFEMSFYLIILTLLWLGKLDRTVPVLSALVVLGMIDGVVSTRWPNPVSLWLRTILALDYLNVLLIGVILYKIRQAPRPAHGLVLLLGLVAPYFHDLSHRNPNSELIVMSLLVPLVYLATCGWLRVLDARPLVFLGTISYSLYLNHNLVGHRLIALTRSAGAPPLISLLLATAAVIVLAAAITYGFEQPATAAIRRRLSAR